MTQDQFAEAFECPDGVARIAVTEPTRMLRAISELGPERVRYDGCWTRGGATGDTAWRLDGMPVTETELIHAAFVG